MATVILPLRCWGTTLLEEYICPLTHRSFTHELDFADHIGNGVVRSYQNDDLLEFDATELAASIIRLDTDLHWHGGKSWTNHDADMAEWCDIRRRYVRLAPNGYENYGCDNDTVVSHTEYVAKWDYDGPTLFTVEVTKGGKSIVKVGE
jgi:hypothetical protein